MYHKLKVLDPEVFKTNKRSKRSNTAPPPPWSSIPTQNAMHGTHIALSVIVFKSSQISESVPRRSYHETCNCSQKTLRWTDVTYLYHKSILDFKKVYLIPWKNSTKERKRRNLREILWCKFDDRVSCTKPGSMNGHRKLLCNLLSCLYGCCSFL